MSNRTVIWTFFKTILFLLWSVDICFSQEFVLTKDAAPKVQKMLLKANQLYQQNKYPKAISLYRKALDAEPKLVEAEIKWASICFDLEDYTCAETHFDRAISLAPEWMPKVYYTLALSNYRNRHFDRAKQNMHAFLMRETKNKDLIDKANELYPNLVFADSAVRYPLHIELKPVQSLNTYYSEYLPSLTADGKTMVFTRRLNMDNEDLFISHLSDTGWTESQPIRELNTLFNEGAPTISPDGKTIVFTSCDRRESYGGCDMFRSEWTESGWGPAVNISDILNTPSYESQPCFADNGKTIYFSSNRKGTLGGRDIWVSHMLSDHKWSAPENLGPSINTSGNDECPFMHPNGRTLFFSSDGWPGMGKADLFMSNKSGPQSWSKPINLGYPINSPLVESAIMVDYTGMNAYIASDRAYDKPGDLMSAKIKNLDIYQFELPASIRPAAASYVLVRITDAKTKEVLQGLLHIQDINSHKTVYKAFSDKNGVSLVALEPSKKYAIHIEKENYTFESFYFETADSSRIGKPKIIDVELKPILQIESKVIVLRNVFFESGSAQLLSDSYFDLDRLAKFLNDNPKIKILITGHTDDVGTETDNLQLSVNRSASVENYLISHGIDPQRLQHEGKGESTPIDINSTEEGRQNNRRVEIHILNP